MHGWILSAVAAFGLVLVPPTTMTAATEDRPVDLELVLAVDSSSSVDSREFALQVEGTVYAFGTRRPSGHRGGRIRRDRRHPGRMVEPYGPACERSRSLVAGPDDAEDLAQMLENAPRLVETGATSLSAVALRRSVRRQRLRGHPPDRRYLRRRLQQPWSGTDDGSQRGWERGIGVNALVIANLGSSLDLYFEREVIIGPGAFVEQAPDYDNYAEAIRRKLPRDPRHADLLVPRSGILQPAESRETVATAKDRR